MRLFDTHCHINDDAFDADRAQVIDRMHEVGIVCALLMGDLSADEQLSLDLLKENEFLYGAFGLHPHDASKWCPELERKLIRLMALDKVKVLGEIGLDYHYDLSPRDVQRDVFDAQLELAYTLDKPVSLHIREAHGDAYDIMAARLRRGRLPRGVMHCYTGSVESAKAYLNMGYYISFSGSLTFKNAPKLAEVAQFLPADRVLIETDCPYMTPVPLRGKRNEPAYVLHTCEKLAEIRGISASEAAEMTLKNGLKAFGISEVI